MIPPLGIACQIEYLTVYPIGVLYIMYCRLRIKVANKKLITMEEHTHEDGHHKLLRWVLGILILIVVFCMGVKVGEFKTTLGYYGYGMWPGMMENGYYGGSPYPYGYMPMMGGYYYQSQNAAPTQSAGAPTYYYGPGGMMRGYYQNAPQATSTK